MMKYLILFEDFDPFSHLSTKTGEEVPEPDKKTCVLGFTIKGNEKIKNPYLSLPAGYTCPHAGRCKTMAVEDPQTGAAKLKSYGDIYCYAASDEVKYPNLRSRNWSNYKLLQAMKTKDEIYKLIEKSFDYHFGHNPPRYFRIHESGDFYGQTYFDAWLDYTKNHPETIFYAFTTSVNLWVKRLKDIPDNFRLTASRGGKQDHLIDKHNLRYMEIVRDVEEAKKKKLNIDINDKLASSDSKEPFAILIHGGQPKGSEFAKYVTANRKLINDLKSKGLA